MPKGPPSCRCPYLSSLTCLIVVLCRLGVLICMYLWKLTHEVEPYFRMSNCNDARQTTRQKGGGIIILSHYGVVLHHVALSHCAQRRIPFPIQPGDPSVRERETGHLSQLPPHHVHAIPTYIPQRFPFQILARLVNRDRRSL
jgi:hypothetical protein